MGLNRQERQENERMEDKKELATKRHKREQMGKTNRRLTQMGAEGSPEGARHTPAIAGKHSRATPWGTEHTLKTCP